MWLPIKSFLVREGKMHDATTKTTSLILKPAADGKSQVLDEMDMCEPLLYIYQNALYSLPFDSPKYNLLSSGL